MQKKDQVFLYIKDEIEKISSAEEKEILDEAKAIEQEAYNQLRGEAEIDAKHQLDKELAEISSKASIEASAQLEERLKKLVEKREEYVNTIFTEVKNKLVEFVNSSNYLEYLTSHVKAVSDEYQMTDCVLCVRKDDLKYADDLNFDITNLKISVSSFMGYLKGKSALMMFDKHANLKYKFGNRHFWSEGYYVSTVGLNEATVKKYIREQELHDQMKDKLSVKEYEDPFKGSK